MATRLVTIAQFDQTAKARLAENVLNEAGIQAAVSDEGIVAMDWLLGNAVGWVKVQVREEDAERAVQALEEAFGADGRGPGPVPPEQPAGEADEADEPGPAARPQPPAAGAGDPAEESVSERDQYARRAVFAGFLSIIFPPAAFYTLYLYLNAALGEGEISDRGRYNLFVGAVVLFLVLGWCLVFCYFI